MPFANTSCYDSLGAGGGGGGESWATDIFIEMQYIITLQCFRHDEGAALDSSLLYAGRSHGSFDFNVTEINIKSGEVGW